MVIFNWPARHCAGSAGVDPEKGLLSEFVLSCNHLINKDDLDVDNTVLLETSLDVYKTCDMAMIAKVRSHEECLRINEKGSC